MVSIARAPSLMPAPPEVGGSAAEPSAEAAGVKVVTSSAGKRKHEDIIGGECVHPHMYHGSVYEARLFLPGSSEDPPDLGDLSLAPAPGAVRPLGPADAPPEERFPPEAAEDIHGDRSQSQREAALARPSGHGHVQDASVTCPRHVPQVVELSKAIYLVLDEAGPDAHGRFSDH